LFAACGAHTIAAAVVVGGDISTDFVLAER